MKNIQTLISDEEHQEFTVAALKRDQTKHSLLKQIVLDFLEKEKQQKEEGVTSND